MFLGSLNLFSQIGVQAQWHNFIDSSFSFNNKSDKESIAFNQLGYSLDYSFRLKNYRVEFFPAIFYASKTLERKNIIGTDFTTDVQTLGVQLNTHFYFLDIFGDCHCPTWNKDGDLIKKGIFAWVSFNGYQVNLNQNSSIKTDFISYGASGGLGLDIGLSKNWTITPIAGLELENRPVIELSQLQAKTDNQLLYKSIFALRLSYNWGS